MAEPEPPVATDADLTGIQVLVVEDEADTRVALSILLSSAGALVSTVGTAAEAMKAINLGRPDLLLCDIGLPGTDGYTLLRQVREQEAAQKAKPIPAVALTAFAREEHRAEAMSAGFQSYFKKPVRPEELLETLQQLAAQADE